MAARLDDVRKAVESASTAEDAVFELTQGIAEAIDIDIGILADTAPAELMREFGIIFAEAAAIAMAWHSEHVATVVKRVGPEEVQK